MSKNRQFQVEEKGGGKKFGEIIFPDHICGAMKKINQQWWWHTNSGWGV
jgi:hypothetical protein